MAGNTTFTLKLERRPRSAARQTANVKAQIKDEYTALGKAGVAELRNEFSFFTKSPTFRYYVRISGTRYALEFVLPLNNKNNLKAFWINEGTEPHIIKGRRGNRLFFTLPSTIRSIPADGRIAKSVTGDPGSYSPYVVHHPGINPRYIMQKSISFLNGRRPGSFYSRTEAAIKRGIRRDKKEL